VSDTGKADAIGYTSMVLAALMVFIGVRSYRENAGGGRLTFGRGLAVGLSISLISAACYVAAFQVMYFKLMPTFGESFAACMVHRARASGASPEKIEETARLAQTLKGMYDWPLTNAALAFSGSFPIGAIASALSAAVLRRK
jgi:hypothetical protein